VQPNPFDVAWREIAMARVCAALGLWTELNMHQIGKAYARRKGTFTVGLA
jgi:hypothetical protein